MKLCSKCKELKDDSDFYKDKRTTDGLTCQCKKCHIATTLATRNKDNAREINKKYMRNAVIRNPEKFREQWRKYEREMILNCALRDKRLFKPQVCQDCGMDLKLTAHHENYDEPLQVTWLCYECHAKRHRKAV